MVRITLYYLIFKVLLINLAMVSCHKYLVNANLREYSLVAVNIRKD